MITRQMQQELNLKSSNRKVDKKQNKIKQKESTVIDK